jgi:hypothetical protein
MFSGIGGGGLMMYVRTIFSTFSASQNDSWRIVITGICRVSNGSVNIFDFIELAAEDATARSQNG